LFEQTLVWSWTHRSTQLIEICPVRLSRSQSDRMSRTGGCALVTTGFFPNCVSVFSQKVEASLPGPCPGGPTCLYWNIFHEKVSGTSFQHTVEKVPSTVLGGFTNATAKLQASEPATLSATFTVVRRARAKSVRRLYSHDRSMPTNTAVFGGQFVLPSRGARGTRLPWPLLETVRRCAPAQAQSAAAHSKYTEAPHSRGNGTSARYNYIVPAL